MNKIKRFFLIFQVFVLFTVLLSGCLPEERKEFRTKEDFNDARLGIMLGSSFDVHAKTHFPDAERVYLMNLTDLILNLEQGKIDAILLDGGYSTPLKWKNYNFSYIDMDMSETEYAVAFSHTAFSSELRAEINEFIRARTESGWIDELAGKWFSHKEPEFVFNIDHLTGENGTIRVATTAECMPYAYMKNGLPTGFDMEFIIAFAEEYGYDLDVNIMGFDAILPSLVEAKYDLAISSITVTEERKESVVFSDPYYNSPVCMVVYSTESQNSRLTLEDFEYASIGVMTGSANDKMVKDFFPNAQRVYFNSVADMVLAVEQEKIDCYISDTSFYLPVLWEGNNVKKVDGVITHVQNGFIFAKSETGDKLRQEMNEFIAYAKDEGILDDLNEKWFDDSEPLEHSQYQMLTGENGTINLAVSSECKPYIYMSNGNFTGYEIDLLTLFGERYGYRFEIEDVTFSSLIAGISEKKYDMGASGLSITPERQESINFSDYYIEDEVILVTKGDKYINSNNLKLPDPTDEVKLGVLTGSIYEGIIKDTFPNAEIHYFTAHSDILLALEQGKIEGFIEDFSLYTTMLWEDLNVISVGEPLSESKSAAIFPKEVENDLYITQFNEFVQKSKEDGTLDSLVNKWMSDSEPSDHPDYTNLSGENGVLTVAISSTVKPMTYMKGEYFTGFEVELITMFAKEYGYSLQFENMTFDGLIPAVMGGRCDMGMSGVAITEERSESVRFSDSYFNMEGVYIVNSIQEEETVSFIDEIIEDFKKTFIREDRWKLILQGIGVTLFISLSSIVLGSVVGFGLYMLSRSDVKFIQVITKSFAKIYSRIVAGTPVVVILMILFYIVFGKMRDMSGALVAIIGFTLTFGAFVYDHMTVSVSSVDRGQTEAAYSLGYSKNKTFFRIIFPQAMSIFMPTYCGHAVELVKATAVVGYIAVNDLTKVGDIIRSNTYEAFFPLLATAVIYFILTWLLSLVLGFVKRMFEPKRRSSKYILRGVKTE